MSAKRKHPILRALLLLVLVLILVAAGYVAYVFIAYKRVPDNIALTPETGGAALPAAAGTGTVYSIMTWNMGFGAYSDDYSFFMDGGKYSRAYSKEAAENNITAMTEYVKEKSPDFALIQEVDINSTRSYHIDESELINSILDGYESVFAKNYDSSYLFYPILCPHGKSVSGIMTESKIAVESALRRQLPIEGGFMKLLDLDRCYSVTRIPVENGKTLCLYNMHLYVYLRRDHRDGTA
ncbi:MAG: endonuclease/exonuclease/phosphatase family protein, partial [Clostridia bacterium]|nr:endonuclease/exonuclease/phosphatase family protein [Clostridia bacterium]